MYYFISLVLVIFTIRETFSSDILGCGGFIKSHVQIDFTKIQVKLYTRQGVLKEKASCAPNNGYYLIPVYDKGDYVLRLEPPAGWSFNPTHINLAIDGVSDLCSQGKDINFVFKGFGITGKVESYGLKEGGPTGILVTLKSDKDVWNTTTSQGGEFFFTPIYPGKYVLTISHPVWHIIKDTVRVEVREGNTDLPPNSLIVGGYDVKGLIQSEELPVKGITVILFKNENNKNIPKVANCNTSEIIKANLNAKQLCHVVSNNEGIFAFPIVSPGSYFVIPYHERQNTHFSPDKISFSVEHDSVFLKKVFEIKGFSIFGKVLTSENGKPLAGTKIYLNGVKMGKSLPDGSFTLEKIKANTYKITFEAEDVKFDEKVISISPNTFNLPTILPSAYKVCGIVLSENPQTVNIIDLKTSKTITLKTDKKTEKFCEYLAPGKYQMLIKTSKEEENTGVQFFPLSHTIEVVSSPISGITFSQLKSEITGKVKCIRNSDCKLIKVLLRSQHKSEDTTFEDNKVTLKDFVYRFSDIKPGNYEVILSDNKFCWNNNQYIITVSSVNEVVPDFVQLGYQITFISSHNTQLYYKIPTIENKKTAVEIPKGRTKICVPKPGKYDFLVDDNCHIYNEEKISFDVDESANEIYLNAIKHRLVFGIEADKSLGLITTTINFGREKIEEKPFAYENGQFLFELYLIPSDIAILVPQSDVFFFSPPILSVTGNNDCTNLGAVFKAIKGKVFKGKISPPLVGVLITIETENSESLMDETNENGDYKFPPLDDSKTYKLSASKNSFVFTGPDSDGNFQAHKLAEVVVEVVDDSTNSPLQGTLLSLSGGDSYRSNLLTGNDGKIRFTSLSPSDYYLRPMMKEFIFQPNSKIVTIKEGATINILLRGKRIAFSIYGQISSLNGEPEEGLTIIATGLNNCSSNTEEATSETNGSFRIRGLQSYCSYSIKVVQNEEKQLIEQAIPESLTISMANKDLADLKFVVLRPILNTNILLKVYTENPENYKSLRVKLVRESAPSAVIQVTKIDVIPTANDRNAGVFVQTLTVPQDNKTYSIQLENINTASKNKAHFLQLIANSPFYYGEIEFEVKKTNFEQHIKQTSVWSLFVILGMIIVCYNIDVIIHFFKLNLRLDFKDFFFKNKIQNQPECNIIDDNEVDQIVQSINATKKKVKSRKI